MKRRYVDAGPQVELLAGPAWLMAARPVPTVEKLRQTLQRKYNPAQLRDPGGEDGGRWVKSPGSAAKALANDVLDLADRIDLDSREQLVSSGRLVGDNGGDMHLNWAAVHSPAGNEVRLGIIPHHDSDKWRAADKGGTAVLDADQLAKFRSDLANAGAEAKKAAKEADALGDAPFPSNPSPREKVLFGMEPVTTGVLPTDWADLHWGAYLTDDESAPWQVTIFPGNPEELEGVQFEPKRFAKLLTTLDGIESELEPESAARSYAADGGGTGATNATATKTTQPKGGQFALGGGRVGGKGKAPAKRPARKAPAKPAGPLGYDGKTGAGYGIKGGDPRVRTLQSILNRFGLKDASGQPLAVDGKFGPRTTAAVKRLQRAMGLTPDGKVTEDFIKKVANAKSLTELRPPKPARKRVRRSADHLHQLDNGICRTCVPEHEHVLDNGICKTCT